MLLDLLPQHVLKTNQLAVASLFLPSYDVARDLYSFPTRRSSDLKDFLKVRCRLALLPFLISCLIWLDLVASLPLIKERILVIILLLHFLSLMLGSVLVLMLPLLVWLTPDLRIKKSLLK